MSADGVLGAPDPAEHLAQDPIFQATASTRARFPGPEPAATALLKARAEIDQLKAGLRSRTVIGQATGLVMASRQLTADAAFALLIEMSQRTNVKLHEIAERLVAEADVRGRVVSSPRNRASSRRDSRE
ncbi:MAG: two-component system response regulator [Marmoricola sp.]|nr:two-component system response regulator [Marmoricola sp.]